MRHAEEKFIFHIETVPHNFEQSVVNDICNMIGADVSYPLNIMVQMVTSIQSTHDKVKTQYIFHHVV